MGNQACSRSLVAPLGAILLSLLAACGSGSDGTSGSSSGAGANSSSSSSSGSSGGSTSSSSSGGSGSSSGAAEAAPLFGHAGRWITDASGRVLIFHGMNYVKKTPTTLPDGSSTLDPAADGFGANDLQWMADNGLNGLRLGIEHYGLEPQLKVFDDTYLEQVASMAQLAVAHGVYPLLDFHEDEYSPAFGDNGFADWMVQDDGLPHQPDPGFPYNQFVMPALIAAWDHFWHNDPAADGTGLQDHFAYATAHVAQRFARIDGLLGYEYLNEPWPGSQWPLCVVPLGCPLFDATLSSFNRRIAPAIRGQDARHLIFAEPDSLFNDGIPTYVSGLGDPNAGFAFHIYCLLSGPDMNSEEPGGAQVCPTLEQLAFSNADNHVAQTGEALLMTEFGSTADTAVVGRMTAAADAHMVSWLWWAYDTRIGLDMTADPPDQHLVGPVIDLLVRPYPRAVAGTPSAWSFDNASKTFSFGYSTQRADGRGAFDAGGITEVYLPARHYPNGYKVSVSGATVLSAPDARVLQLKATAPTVQLTVTPKS